MIDETAAALLASFDASAADVDEPSASRSSTHRNPTLSDAVDSLVNLTTELRFVSGKWFVKRNPANEIANIEEFICKLANDHRKSLLAKYCTSRSRVNEVIQRFIMLESRHIRDSRWPELRVVSAARKVIESGTRISFEQIQSVYPVDEGILRLLNIMLWHPYEAPIILVHGKRQTGKSVQFRLVKQLFEDDFESASLDEIESRFGLANLTSHRLIGGDEVCAGKIHMTENLKKIQTHEEIRVEKKGVDAITVKPQMIMFYCTNNVPNFDVNLNMDGIVRRIVYYVLNKTHQINTELETRQLTFNQLVAVAVAAYSYESEYPHWKDYFMPTTYRYLLQPKISYKFFENRERFLKDSYAAKSLPLYEQYRLYCTDYEYISPTYIARRSSFESECELLHEWGIIDDDNNFING